VAGAKALIAHLSGLNAGRFTRIDIEFAAGLDVGGWREGIGLLRVDASTTMMCGRALVTSREARLFSIVTQALG
jgi:hypothetical protein